MSLRADKVEAAVAEFNALRNEIAYRSQSQHLLINLNLIASGTIGGIAITRPANEELLLLVTVISAALGLLYTDHSRSIAFIGRYIDRELVDVEGNPLFGWESRSRDYVAGIPRILAFRFSLFLVFVGPPAVALGYLVPSVKDFWPPAWWNAAWHMGFLVTLFMAVVLLVTPLKPEEKTEGSSEPQGVVSS